MSWRHRKKCKKDHCDVGESAAAEDTGHLFPSLQLKRMCPLKKRITQSSAAAVQVQGCPERDQVVPIFSHVSRFLLTSQSCQHLPACELITSASNLLTTACTCLHLLTSCTCMQKPAEASHVQADLAACLGSGTVLRDGKLNCQQKFDVRSESVQLHRGAMVVVLLWPRDSIDQKSTSLGVVVLSLHVCMLNF